MSEDKAIQPGSGIEGDVGRPGEKAAEVSPLPSVKDSLQAISELDLPPAMIEKIGEEDVVVLKEVFQRIGMDTEKVIGYEEVIIGVCQEIADITAKDGKGDRWEDVLFGILSELSDREPSPEHFTTALLDVLFKMKRGIAAL